MVKQVAPTVSVLVQTYQHAPYIQRCLDSLISQHTDFHYEILVGEDASTDGTRKICQTYEQAHPDRIRLFLHDRKNVIYINGRPTGRFNFSHNLKAATGKYLAFCEGDDYWTDPQKLQKQVDFLEANPDYALSFHNVRIADHESNVLEKWKVADDTIRNFDPESFEMRMKVPLLSAMLRRDAVSLPDEFYKVYNADTFLICLVGQFGKSHFHPDIQDAVAHIHEGGMWSSLESIDRLKASNDTLTSLISLVKPDYRAEVKTCLANQYARLAKLSVKSLKIPTAINSLLNFFKYRTQAG